ncbi:hypothetical protein [Cryobacterium psychrophilum]|uniref:Peptidase S11 D-alanyl-D-alanine carboxypeptidase A N-terminal domain-containing protein n=1 Tax=Cryobacterium psychrophilum TaxID=41988 RepID=A0A4Y8KN62_9MICO|nr:hypothetical protein [Cryobacterium psychrophilum]TDW31275.1 D-alanyl-D-alanine carboxypeptidase (penicillin-binding protein 5/6) [Cryobacterium psychrophilum]TFD78438.1 hypothetical protein E3T53_09595 [Cryobacterium psychrophilum]
MSRFRPGRFIGVLVGTVAILAVGVYGPLTLLGPLPSATATLLPPPAPAAIVSPPALPTAGTSAVTALRVDESGSIVAPTIPAAPIAAAGSTTPLPLAAIAKVITALVAFDAKPLTVGETGPAVTLTAADYQSYLDYTARGSRAVTVFQGEVWSEQELLQAMLLGSSNNHADTIARWAFGSVDAYVEAANAWLTKQGFDHTSVVDATGLHDASAGTGTDLAALAGLAAGNPVIAEILASPASALADRRGIDNTTAYLPELGITGISRSYTDAAGVCFLFTARIVDGDKTFAFAGAIVGEPDYNTLDADLAALMTSATDGVTELPLLKQGDAYVRFNTTWGATSSGTVGYSRNTYAWQASAPVKPSIDLDPVTTGRAGTVVGHVTVDGTAGEASSTLKLDRTIPDPGPGWRLLHPVPLINALLDSRG